MLDDWAIGTNTAIIVKSVGITLISEKRTCIVDNGGDPARKNKDDAGRNESHSKLPAPAFAAFLHNSENELGWTYNVELNNP